MRNPTRFHKERTLRTAGVAVQSYPTAQKAADLESDEQLLYDRQFLRACSEWEDEIDRQYLELIKALPQFAPTADIRDFVARCKDYGLTAGLTALNGRVPHRYTAVYQLEDLKLRNIELVDKVGEARPEFLAEVPLGDSFCQFVLRDGVFFTSNAGLDRRLDGHKYQEAMGSYHGVPVLDAQGQLYGSLCHFDTEPQPLSDAEFEHLQRVALTIVPFLKP